jgi:hypothetical protein
MRASAPVSHRTAPALLLLGLLGLASTWTARAQDASGNAAPAAAQPAVPAPATPPPRPTMGLRVPLTQAKDAPPPAAPSTTSAAHRNTGLNEKARNYYAAVWGVDKLRASSTNSGALIRFSYRVLQPQLAAPLGDHENTPEMVGIRSNAVLHVPNMEKLGQLRQMSAAVPGKEYWMVFSNKGNLVKQGDEVSVIIGRFRAEGLVVQ